MMRFAMSSTSMPAEAMKRSEEHTSELQSQSNLVCRLLLEKKKTDNVSHCGSTCFADRDSLCRTADTPSSTYEQSSTRNVCRYRLSTFYQSASHTLLKPTRP